MESALLLNSPEIGAQNPQEGRCHLVVIVGEECSPTFKRPVGSIRELALEISQVKASLSLDRDLARDRTHEPLGECMRVHVHVPNVR